MSKKRKQYSAEFKAKVALAAIKGDQTTPELAARLQLHPTMVSNWKRELLERAGDTMDADFCVDALEEALDRFGTPEVFNTDQGSQFTSDAFTGVLKERNTKISMDGKGCYRDNIFVERLWRSVKYECVYLKAFNGAVELKQELKSYFQWYSAERPHQGLDNKTPDHMYFKQAA